MSPDKKRASGYLVQIKPSTGQEKRIVYLNPDQFSRMWSDRYTTADLARRLPDIAKVTRLQPLYGSDVFGKK